MSLAPLELLSRGWAALSLAPLELLSRGWAALSLAPLEPLSRASEALSPAPEALSPALAGPACAREGQGEVPDQYP
jgi:hypothetical protein